MGERTRANEISQKKVKRRQAYAVLRIPNSFGDKFISLISSAIDIRQPVLSMECIHNLIPVVLQQSGNYWKRTSSHHLWSKPDRHIPESFARYGKLVWTKWMIPRNTPRSIAPFLILGKHILLSFEESIKKKLILASCGQAKLRLKLHSILP